MVFILAAVVLFLTLKIDIPWGKRFYAGVEQERERKRMKGGKNEAYRHET